jgi:hypothetical protein
MQRNANTGELGGWRTEVKYVAFSEESAAYLLEDRLILLCDALELFGFDRLVVSLRAVHLKAHGDYLADLVRTVRLPEMLMFKSERGIPLDGGDSMRMQDLGRILDIWNACRVDCQFTTSARFLTRNWARHFYTDFDYTGNTGTIRVQRGNADALGDEMSAFDEQAARYLSPQALLVYKALAHRMHPNSKPTKWGTTNRGSGGISSKLFSSPLDTARHWLATLGELSDARWLARPVNLKQDMRRYTGERFAVGGVAQIS